MKTIKFVKLSSKAITPVKGSPGAAGFDLFSAEDCYVSPGKCRAVKTDIAIALPKDTYGRIAPRSGLALRRMVDIGGGVIDADYRGNVAIIIFNHHEKNKFQIKKGDRIAQLICEKIESPQWLECDVLTQLSSTERGADNFGSTGK